MRLQVDIGGLKNKKLRFGCVDEKYLKTEMQSAGKVAKCSYWGTRQKSYTIAAMAERIADVFDEHYTRTSDQPDSFQQMMLSDRESSYEWDRDGEPVVYAIMMLPRSRNKPRKTSRKSSKTRTRTTTPR
ncbi:hypothetical protein [Bosea vaviloviae]|uniref:hypothetical protein n=1 Tax=Bosea vaviloviae TaxID=1526658 RepID=UPI0006BA959D|nr:hypothetical protein [Bosea vaviloviae]